MTHPEFSSSNSPTDVSDEKGSAGPSRGRRYFWGLRRWTHRLIYIGFLLPVAVILAFAGAIHFMDFNQYKPEISEQFHQKTGQWLDIEGPIEVSVWPFTVGAQQVAFKTTSDQTEPWAKVAQVEVTLSLWSLFVEQRLNALGVELIEPTLTLSPETPPIQSFDQWVSASVQPLAKTPPQKRVSDWVAAMGEAVLGVAHASSDASAPEKVAWELDALIVQSAQVAWQSAQTSWQLTDLNVSAFDLADNRPFNANLSGQFQHTSWGMRGRFDGSGEVKASLAKQTLNLQDWRSDWGIGASKNPQKHSTQDATPLQMTLTWAQASLDAAAKTFHVKQAKLLGLVGRMQGDLAGNWQTGAGDAQWSTTQLNVRQLAEHLGKPLPAFASSNALTDVSMQGALKWQSPQQWSLPSLTARLDQAHIQMSAQQAPKAPLTFKLHTQALNLDDYQAWWSPQSPAADHTAAKRAQAAPQVNASDSKPAAFKALPLGLPIDTLRQAWVQGQFTAETLTYEGVTYRTLEAAIEGSQGQWHLNEVRAALFQGQLTGSLQLDVTGQTPAYQAQGQIEQLALAPLWQATSGNAPLKGRLTGSFDLASKGVNADLLKRNAHGQIEGRIAPGAWQNIAWSQLLTGQSKTGVSTAFESLRFHGQVDQGRVQWDTLRLDAPLWQAQGEGIWDWGQDQVAMTFHTQWQGRLPAFLKPLKGMVVPIHAKGTTADLQWQAPLKGSIQQRLEQELEQGLKALDAWLNPAP